MKPSASPLRRVAAAALLLCVCVTLALAARHNHLDRDSRQADGCVFCTGALATAPGSIGFEPPRAFIAEGPQAFHAAAPKRFLLQLDHSGCAPPVA
jgi:hypothetical protein